MDDVYRGYSQTTANACREGMEHKIGGSPTHSHGLLAPQWPESMQLMPKNSSKAARRHALKGGAPALPVKSAPPGLTSGMSTNEAFKAILASCLAHLQANEEGMLLGQDPEYLHQMRVALRRLRSAQSVFDAVIPRVTYPEISAGLKWLDEQLGPARDWDVLITETLPPLMDQFPEHKALAALHRRVVARQQHYAEIARAAVRSGRYAKLLLTLGAWLEREEWLAHVTDTQQQELAVPIDKLARRTLGKRDKQLRKRGRNLMELSMAERHAVRIAAKKLRYAADFFAELFEHSRAHGYLSALAGLQDGLGALNDLAMTRRLLASFHAPRSGAAQSEAIGITLGWAACRGAQFQASLQHPWDAFVHQKPFWGK